MSRPVSFVMAVGVLALSFAASGSVANDKLSPFLKQSMSEKKSDLSAMVIMREQAELLDLPLQGTKTEKGRYVYAELSAVAKATQVELIAWLKENEIEYQSFYIYNAIAVFGVDGDLLEQIASREDVGKLVANVIDDKLAKVIVEADDDAKPEAGVGANISAVKADQVWSTFGVEGEGIIIGAQDTGISWQHNALKDQYRGWDGETADHDFNWHDAVHRTIGFGRNPCGIGIQEPCDDNGHGTHTLGTAVGSDGGANIVGVAPGAKWMGCRNMERGNGRASTYIECFEWFLAPYAYGADPQSEGDPDQAPHVINNSWGCIRSEGCAEAEILPAIQAMNDAGIMVVAAAGNDGPGCDSISTAPPMHSDWTLGVGAHSHETGNIASFSSRGPSTFDGGLSPDVTAPGVRIRSTTRFGGYSSRYSGTSMASPHVAGVVALLWSADNTLIGDIDATVEIIRSTAIPTQSEQSCGGVPGDMIPNNTFGYGKVDAFAAVSSRMEQ